MEHDNADTLPYQCAVRQINKREPAMRAKSDEEPRTMTDKLRIRPTPHTHQSARKPHLSIVPRQDDDTNKRPNGKG
jgi:hypothetical protein